MPENKFRFHSAGFDRLLGVADRLQRLASATLAGGEHTLPQQRVLCALLNAPGSTDKAIAASLAMDSSHLSRVRKTLVAGGLISVAPHPVRKAQFLLTLTEDGETAAKAIDAARTEIYREGLSRLAPEERQMMLNGIGGPNPYILGPVAPRIVPAGIQQMGSLMTMAYRFGEELKWNAQFPTSVATLMGKLFKYVDDGFTSGWVVLSQNRVVGGALLETDIEIDSYSDPDHRARIVMLYVLPNHRGKRLGRGLLEACLGQARRQSEDVVIISLPARQKASIRFLKKNGFRQDGRPVQRHQYGLNDDWSDFHVSLTK